MNLEVKLQMKMQQKLIMTPNLQLAIRLLQLTKMELKEVLEQNMLENPVLEMVPEGEQSEELSSQKVEEKSPEAELEPVLPDKIAEGPENGNDDMRWEELDEYLREEYDYGYMPREQKDVLVYENLTGDAKSLFDILSEQLLWTNLSDEKKRIGIELIGYIDDNGYLGTPVEEIATDMDVSPDDILEVLSVVQTFEPSGVAARDLKECMLIQIDQLYENEEIARKIVESHLEDIEKSNFERICQDLDISQDVLDRAMEVILGLEPKPGRKYSTDETRYIIPDVIITKVDDEFVVLLNDEGIPRLRISNLYLSILKDKKTSNEKTRDYIEKKLNSAKWLIRSIEQRQQTLYKVAKSILTFQYEFFEKGIDNLKPLVLRDVAEDISMHESTVSRVSTNKYMHTPRGVFELKYFFHSGLSTTFGEDISSLRIKEIIKKLVQNEEPKKPYSDQKIAQVLLKQGIKIARRTVAKYREELKIPPSNRRKKR